VATIPAFVGRRYGKTTNISMFPEEERNRFNRNTGKHIKNYTSSDSRISWYISAKVVVCW
jgi:hypothetical protein